MLSEFSVEPTVLFRQKVLSSQSIPENILYSEEILHEVLKNKVFKEQLQVASTELYNKLIKYHNVPDDFSNKERRHLIESITNYYLRATHRNTPFGLFSGVFSTDITDFPVDFENGAYHKDVTISFRWFYTLLKSLVFKNPKCFNYTLENHFTTFDDRMFFLNVGINDHPNDEIGFKINRTKLVKLLDEICGRDYIPYNEILKLVSKSYPTAPKSFLEKYLNNLINHNILKPDCYPSLSASESQIINGISIISQRVGDHNLVDKLVELQESVKSYNGTALGTGQKYFQKIASVMNELCTVDKDDLNVNLYLGSVSISPNKTDIKNIEDAFTFLMNIALPEINMQDYTYAFVEKFGTNTEVPLNIMIDENLGIGIPKTFVDSKDGLESLRTDISNYFMQKIDAALLNNEDVILNKKDLDSVQNIKGSYSLADEIQRTPESFDVCLTINNDTLNDRYDHSMYVSEILGSTRGFSMKGRFRKFDDARLRLYFKNIYKEYDLCDINVLPSKLDYSNLSNTRHYGDYELSVGVSDMHKDKSIQFKDILIGYTEEGLYVKSRITGQKIIFLEENMLNDQLKSPIVQLLLHLSNDRNTWWFNYPWTAKQGVHAVLPKIVYKNIVVSPRTWFFPFSYTSISTKEISFSEFKIKFINFAKMYKMPNVFYYTESDNRIISNLEKEESLYAIYKSAKKMHLHYLKLEAPENGQLKSSYKDEEAVFTLTSRKPGVDSDNFKGLKKREFSPISPKNFNNHWLYIDLKFGTESWKNVFLKNNLADIFSEFKRFYERKFFIQYATDKNVPTVRLRFKCHNSRDTIHLTSMLSSFLDNLIDLGHVLDYSFCNYYPEVFRYGGNNLMEKSEEVFDIDSLIAENIITQDDEISKFYMIFSCLNYLATVHSKVQEAVTYLKRFDSLKGKRKLNQWIRVNEDGFENMTSKFNEKFLSLIKERNRVTKNIFDSIHDDGTKADLLSSFLHMACNRSMGTNRERESEIMYLIYRITMITSFKGFGDVYNLFNEA
ncbi:thiopeptide-type bacteriocin biosynthesis protein [Pediococcus acidilactici]|uniref:lantibiotic dehydratase n=1 Tax=Pediococcus acidilactici TaxID=1254 RepID=UPI00270FA5EA|nr:lantibiotic dehydratase [Pediococcus acidilactici]MDO7803160.1 thiopeptide-type bacteriocin biosynthesis protein [Pediococcus acidilactici]